MRPIAPIRFCSTLPPLRKPLCRPVSLHNLSSKTALPFHSRLPPRRAQISRRSMGSAPQQKCEWLVILPDHENALEKRVKVRQEHLAKTRVPEEEGFWLFGGAFMSDVPKADSTPPMIGSAMLAYAATKEEVVERLKRDIYTTSGVWDWDKVQIYPFRSAIRKGL